MLRARIEPGRIRSHWARGNLFLLIFALGEMAGSPKNTESLGRMAAKDKRALHIGC